jgi:biotin transport system substrate-specific component
LSIGGRNAKQRAKQSNHDEGTKHMLMKQDAVLQEALWATRGNMIWVKRLLLVIAGVAALTIAAKAQFWIPPSPVPVTMGTFAVLTIATAYGRRLGLFTILAYLAIGALGFDVFANSSAENNGLSYMMGTTGGYLIGYVLATLFLGWTARNGWDRSVLWMGLGLLIANVLIYAAGVPWLHMVIENGGMFDASKYASVIDQTLTWGLTPYLIGDAMKLALAALLIPAVWKLVGDAR